MKRFISLLCLSSVMLFSGCDNNILNPAPELEKSFRADIKLKIGDENILGQVCRYGENSWELDISEPFPLQGLKVTIDSDGTKFSMLGFEAEADFSDNAVSGLRLLADIYELAADNAAGFTENSLSGTSESGDYTVTLDEDGNLCEIILKDCGITAQFTSYENTEEKENTDEDILIIE